MDGDVNRPKAAQTIPDDARCVFNGILFDVYQWDQRLFDNSTRTLEMLRRPDTVLVLPVFDDGRILLAEQDRPGGSSFIGALGGRVEKGERAVDAARRELLEESGYEASEMILWEARHPFAKIDWVVYIYVAKGIRQVSGQNLEGGERIRLFSVTFQELIQLAVDPRFEDRELAWKIVEAEVDHRARARARSFFVA